MQEYLMPFSKIGLRPKPFHYERHTTHTLTYTHTDLHTQQCLTHTHTHILTYTHTRALHTHTHTHMKTVTHTSSTHKPPLFKHGRHHTAVCVCVCMWKRS